MYISCVSDADLTYVRSMVRISILDVSFTPKGILPHANVYALYIDEAEFIGNGRYLTQSTINYYYS